MKIILIILLTFLCLFIPFKTTHAEGEILFSDNFSDGILDGWTIENGNWFINNGNLAGSKSGKNFGGRISSTQAGWENYIMELDFNVQEGIDMGVGFRHLSGVSGYELNFRVGTGIFDTPQIILRKAQDGVVSVIANTHSFPLINNKWYHLKTEVNGENIKVWVDNTAIFDIKDTETKVKKGGITFSYWTGVLGIIFTRFDNIVVTKLTPALSKTPLIIIPGIGGSELKVKDDTFWSKGDGHGGSYNHAYIKDEKVWVNEPEAAKPGQDDYFDVLRMKEDGIESEANIVATGDVVDRAYKETIDFFISNGYTLDEDLFIFPYDWRKNISDTALLLDQKIQQIKQQTESQKVDIVSHSMGGLVARNYIADPARAQNIRKLFTLGTPHLGTVDFLKNLRYGGCFTKPELQNLPYCIGLTNLEVKDVIQNMIGGFQLAPSQTYFNFYSDEDNSHPYPYRTEVRSLNYLGIKNLLGSFGHNTSLFTPSESFHDLDSTLSNTNGVDVTIIAGSGIQTLGQIIERTITTLNNNKVVYKDKIDINGDGTVPLLSAALKDSQKNLSFLGDAKIYYVDTEHGGLVFNGPALNLVKNILEDNDQLPVGVSTEPYKLKGHSLSVHSPISIHVYDQNGYHTGFTQDGDIEINIPGSSYDILGDAKFVYLPADGVYTVRFEATSEGSFDFKIRKFENDENTKTVFYKEIPLTDNTKAETTFDTNSDQLPLLKVDENGDGTFDFDVNYFSILEGEANYDYTPPVISFDVNPKVIWQPNNKMVDVNITGSIADERPYLITILVDDEYDLIEPSITIHNQTDINQTINLEAARREEDKDGRVYTIKVLATDLAGNTSLSTAEVIVPHDQSKKK